jgi:hypothetical protein
VRLTGRQGHEEIEKRHLLSADMHLDGQVEPVANWAGPRQADHRSLGRLAVLGVFPRVFHDDPGEGFELGQDVGEEAHGLHPTEGRLGFEAVAVRCQQFVGGLPKRHPTGLVERLEHRRSVGVPARVTQSFGHGITGKPRVPVQIDPVALAVADPQDQRLVRDLGQGHGPVAGAHLDLAR